MLGQQIQAGALREIEWATAKKAPALFVAVENALVEHNPHLLGAIRWVDAAGRALRRTWMKHWRTQYVEIISLSPASLSVPSPARPPRAVRSHYRWSWSDRLTRNAWWGPPRLRVTIAGVPAALTLN